MLEYLGLIVIEYTKESKIKCTDSEIYLIFSIII